MCALFLLTSMCLCPCVSVNALYNVIKLCVCVMHALFHILFIGFLLLSLIRIQNHCDLLGL